VNSPPLSRVSSHEIGHILGLQHYPLPKGYLMTSNGHAIAIDGEEAAIADVTARALLGI
jgi:hypothetical protein